MNQQQFDKKVNGLMVGGAIAHSAGLIGGLAIAYKKKKGFWGYVGFGLLGIVVAGAATAAVTIPMYNNYKNQLDKGQSSTNTNTNTGNNTNGTPAGTPISPGGQAPTGGSAAHEMMTPKPNF